jgi:GTP-binding protein
MKAEFLALASSVNSFPKPSFPEIAFVGRSNAGKSSLLNTLIGQKIARTSSTPGRTQGLCFFRLEKLIFVDFPGFGYAKVSKQTRMDWGQLAENYYASRKTLRGTVWIYDIRREVDSLDHQMKEWLEAQGKPYLLALTKADRVKRSERESQRAAIAQALEVDPDEMVVFSSKTREGMQPLWHWIKAV